MSKRWKMMVAWWLDPNRLFLTGALVYTALYVFVVHKLYVHFKFRFLGKFCELIGLSERREIVFAGVLLFVLLLILAIGLAIDCIEDNRYYTKEK